MTDTKVTMEESSIAFVDDESVSRRDVREGRSDSNVARQELVKGQTRTLLVWKLSVVGAIGAVTLIVCLTLFYSSKRDEARMYESAVSCLCYWLTAVPTALKY